MFTLDDAITRFENEAKAHLERIDLLEDVPMFGSSPEDKEMIDKCYQKANECKQIVSWLKDYKYLLSKNNISIENYDEYDI